MWLLSLIIPILLSIASPQPDSGGDGMHNPVATLQRQIALVERRLAIKREQAEILRRLKAREQADAILAEFADADALTQFRLKYLAHKMVNRAMGNRLVRPAWFHRELSEQLVLLAKREVECDHLTGAFSRGFAKSTIGTEDFVLWLVASELSPNTIIVGASSQEKEYRTRLRNIARELETNKELLARYPGIAPAKDAKGGWIANNDDELVLVNGCRIACMPFGGNIRGQSYLGARPSVVIFDDPMTRKMVRSKALLAQAREWVDEDLLGTEGAEGMLIVWLGTFLGYDDLLNWLMKPEDKGGKGWSGPKGKPLLVPMLNEKGESNWPEYFTQKRCSEIKKKAGPRAFAVERMLQVRPTDDAIYFEQDFLDNAFDPRGLRYVEGHWELFGVPLKVYQHTDPAISEDESACYFCIATIGISPTEDLYLLDLVRTRIPFTEQVPLVQAKCDEWRPVLHGIETTAYQKALYQAALATRALPLVEVARTGNDSAKEDRLEGFSPHVRNGKLHVRLDQEEQREFIQEAVEFPLGKFVDALDAVESAATLALAGGGGDSTPDFGEDQRDLYDELDRFGGPL